MDNVSDYDWGHDNPEYDAIYAEESTVGDVAELIASAMEKRNMSRAELAGHCGITLARTIRQLDGRTDMTVRELAAMCHRLGYELHLTLVDRVTGEQLSLS